MADISIRRVRKVVTVAQFLGHFCPRTLRRWGLGFAGLLFFLFVTPGSDGQAQAAGELLVAPTRIVLEGRTRSAYVTLVNKGTKRTTYRITVENRRMLEDGRFETVVDALPGERFARTMIRYAPRRIVLEPNAPQAIRVLLRKPPGLEEGEYRSHMLFRAVPDAPTGDASQGATDGAQKNFGIQLIAIYGVSIPVIVRHGDINADLTITDAEFQPANESNATPTVSVRLARTGARSVYGDLNIQLLGEDGSAQPIGLVRGLAVYSPNANRTVRVPIDPSAAPRLKGGRIKVSFLDSAETGGQALAEGQFTLR